MIRAVLSIVISSLLGGVAGEGHERLSPSAVYVLANVVAVGGLIAFIGFAVASIREAPRGRRGR